MDKKRKNEYEEVYENIKKIIFVVIIVLLVLFDIQIIRNFNDLTIFYGIIDKNENVRVNFKYEHIYEDDLYHNQKYIHARTRNGEELLLDLDGNEYKAKDMYQYTENRAGVYSVSLEKWRLH